MLREYQGQHRDDWAQWLHDSWWAEQPELRARVFPNLSERLHVLTKERQYMREARNNIDSLVKYTHCQKYWDWLERGGFTCTT